MRVQLTEQPMNQAIQRLTLVFVGLFAACCAAVAVYQFVWVIPARQCEAHGAWWDPDSRICATPIFLPALTHRPIGAPKLAPPAKPKT